MKMSAHSIVSCTPGLEVFGVVGATLPLWIPAFAGMTGAIPFSLSLCPTSSSYPVAGTIRFRTKTGGGLASPHPSGFRLSPE